MEVKSYRVTPRCWYLRDADDDRLARLRFHIERGDYFPFLATIMSMLGEAVKDSSGPSDIRTSQVAFAEEMRKDLVYLHQHYDLIPKKQRLAFTKEKMVRFGHEYP